MDLPKIPAPIKPLASQPVARPRRGKTRPEDVTPVNSSREISLPPEEYDVYVKNKALLRQIYAQNPRLSSEFSGSTIANVDLDGLTPIEIEQRIEAAKFAPGNLVDKTLASKILNLPTLGVDRRWGLDGSLCREVEEDAALQEASRLEISGLLLGFNNVVKIGLLWGSHVYNGYIRSCDIERQRENSRDAVADESRGFRSNPELPRHSTGVQPAVDGNMGR